MKLQRCTCQADDDPSKAELYGFYCDELPSQRDAVLSMLEGLQKSPLERSVYCLTSLARICLLSQDDFSTPWWIIVSALGTEDYAIDCHMPQELQPWKHSRVRTEARSTGEAVATVIEAMEYSKGWDDSIGAAPIGLSEILKRHLTDFRVPEAREQCRILWDGWRNEARLCPQTGKKTTVTVVCETAVDEVLAYRHDAATTTSRWGLLPIDPTGPASMGRERNWFGGLQDAFLCSKAWDRVLPEDLPILSFGQLPFSEKR